MIDILAFYENAHVFIDFELMLEDLGLKLIRVVIEEGSKEIELHLIPCSRPIKPINLGSSGSIGCFIGLGLGLFKLRQDLIVFLGSSVHIFIL